MTDVDQDGVAEIAALYEGNATLAPVIYVYKTRLKNGKLKVRRKFTFSFPLGTGVGKDSIKVYDSTGGKMIVAAPDTFSFNYAKSNSSAPVVFINGAGTPNQIQVRSKARRLPMTGRY